MAVVIEAFDVVIRNATVEKRFPHGMIALEASSPKRTFCTDGLICRIGFATLEDLLSFVAQLHHLGFIVPGSSEGPPEIAVVDPMKGLRFPCDWLVVEEIENGDESVIVAAVPGTDPSCWVAPEGWGTPGARLENLSRQDLEYVGRVPDTMVEAYVHRRSGEIILVERAQGSAAAISSELDLLRHEMAYLLVLEERKPGSAREHIGSCYRRAKALALSTEWNEIAAPLYLAGVFARLFERWTEAEAIFRRLTTLDPEHVEGWLELTRVLAHRRRFRQAEEAARAALAVAPRDGRALANLAGVLLRLGRLDEARPLAVQAVEAAPTERMNRRVLAAIDGAARKRANPWWRGLWRLLSG